MAGRKIERSRPSSGQLPSLEPHPEPIRIGGGDSGTPAVTDSGTTEVPKYARMVRKEARLRPDQADALAALRRRVSAARSQRGEPITDNTLLRLATDVLLAYGDDLTGNTEDELRESLRAAVERAPER